MQCPYIPPPAPPTKHLSPHAPGPGPAAHWAISLSLRGDFDAPRRLPGWQFTAPSLSPSHSPKRSVLRRSHAVERDPCDLTTARSRGPAPLHPAERGNCNGADFPLSAGWRGGSCRQAAGVRSGLGCPLRLCASPAVGATGFVWKFSMDRAKPRPRRLSEGPLYHNARRNAAGMIGKMRKNADKSGRSAGACPERSRGVRPRTGTAPPGPLSHGRGGDRQGSCPESGLAPPRPCSGPSHREPRSRGEPTAPARGSSASALRGEVSAGQGEVPAPALDRDARGGAYSAMRCIVSRISVGMLRSRSSGMRKDVR